MGCGKLSQSFRHPGIRGNRPTGREKNTRNKIVLDAGCETGRVTKIITDTAKEGKVYAVDTDANMTANAKKSLKGFSNTVFIKSDLPDLDLPEKVDCVFSNAAIHRILDHEKPVTKFWESLKQGGETFNSAWRKR